MDVLGDLVARERRRKEPLVYGAASQPYTAHKFCTDAWKTASLFRYHGVGPGRPVAIADDPVPETLLALFGAGLLGATARFGDPVPSDGRVLVGSGADVTSVDTAPGTKRVAYGEQPDDPDVLHFERDIWSENPTMPPDEVSADADVLATAERTYSHETLLTAAERVVAEQDLTTDDEVAMRASLTAPGTVVAGVLAPLTVEASIVLPGADRTGTIAVSADDEADHRTLAPSTVSL